MTKELTLLNQSQAEVEGVALRLSALLDHGSFLALTGDLGAGKTTFTKALAAGLGVYDVLSPTFTIVREHLGGRIPLFHFDAYRLSSGEDLYAIGFEDYLAREGIVVMEWCEIVSDALPEERLNLSITGSGEAPRALRFTALGAFYEAILEKLK